MTPDRIGPYRVEEVLGSGGMGTVYAAWDERLERRVAIKSIHPDRELSPDRLERLMREARSAAGLGHPAIAQVHDIVTHDARTYIVMEFVEGRALSEILEGGPLPVDEVVRIGRQVAEGLHAAHERGIVHRDLKADNIMVSASGRAKILDFGLAKRLDPSGTERQLTAEGMVMGTCHAMSPEQAEGSPVDHRSDLFALGSLLYRMLAGEHPFLADTPMATMRRVVVHTPKPLDRIDPRIPTGLARLVERLLAKEPGNRPASAAEVAEQLAELSDRSDSRAAEPPTVLAPAGTRLTRARRLRRLAAAAGAALVVAAVATVLGWRLLVPEPPIAVAVLRPQFEGLADEHTELATRAVREALLSTVSGLDGLLAVYPEAIDGIDGDPTAVARAVAADELVMSTLAAEGETCQVTVRRVRGSDGSLVRTSGTFVAPLHNLLLLAEATSASLQSLYPHLETQRGFLRVEASNEDYTEYLAIARRLNHPQEPGTIEDQLDQLRELRQRSPKLMAAYFTEATYLRYLYQTTGRGEYLERAVKVAGDAVRVAPDDPRALHCQFEVALAANDLEEARRIVTRLEKLHGSPERALVDRAILLESQREYRAAREQYLEILKLLPAWNNFGAVASVEMRLGMVEEARAHLTEGLARAPDTPYLLSKLGQLELSAGRAQEAEKLYQRLSELRPSVVYLGNLGTARMLLGDYSGASEAFAQALEIVPEEPTILLSLAECRELAGDAESAPPLYRRAIAALESRTSPDDLEAVAVRSQCLAHLGDSLGAAEATRRLLELAPNEPQALFVAALVYTLIDERSSALVNARRALELGFQRQWFDMPWFDPIRDRLPATKPQAPNPAE